MNEGDVMGYSVMETVLKEVHIVYRQRMELYYVIMVDERVTISYIILQWE